MTLTPPTHRVPLACAALALAICALSLAGAQGAVPWLVEHGADAPRKLSSALGVLGCVFGLGALSLGRGRLGAAFGAFVLLWGLGGFLQFVFGWVAPWDAWLLGGGVRPMAPTTALVLFALGCCFLVLSDPRPSALRLSTAALLGVIALIEALLALWGFAADSETTYGWGHLSQMSLYTAQSIGVLGVGTVAFALRREPLLDRRAFALGCAALLAVFGLWQALIAEERSELLEACQLRARESASEVSAEFQLRLASLEAFSGVSADSDFWSRSNGFDRAAGQLLEQVGIRQLWWLDEQTEVLWSLPAGTPFKLASGDPRHASLALASETEATLVSVPHPTPHGTQELLVATPQRGAQGAARGVLVGALESHAIARRERETQRVSGYVLELESDGVGFGPGHETKRWEAKWEARHPFTAGGRVIDVRVWPTLDTLLEQRSPLPEIVLALGIVLSLGSSVLLQVGKRASLQAELALEARSDAEQAHAEADTARQAAERDASQLALANSKLEVEVSLRAEHERELQAKRVELTRSNRDLEQFAYVAAHDLRSPLRAIAQLSEWIEEDLEDDLPPGPRKHMDLLRARVKRLGALLDGLLNYSRVGRRDHDLVEVDLDKLVRDLPLLLDVPEGLSVEAGDGLPTLTTHRTPLQTVLRNLVGNAIKHHDRETGRIVVSAKDEGEFLAICVDDDGPGIPEKYRESVFKLFSTLKPRDEVDGSGMGLAIVKKTVERVGGAVELAESPLGRGVRFRFTWPKSLQSQPRAIPEGGTA